MQISTTPSNPAEAAVIARARQLTDFRWTPLRDVPTYTTAQGKTVLPAGIEVTGFPYSSTELKDKFFTENVSFETFISAISNPHSKLYQPGHGALDACNYGIVCNGLVRYALGIPYRVSTARWYTIPGMNKIKAHGEYTVDEICLCDVLYAYGEGRSHVALITDVLRSEDGTVTGIEVSEAVRPTCKRAVYTPEAYYEKFKPFALYRYEKLMDVPTLDEDTDRLLWNSQTGVPTPKITVDNGNKSNYLVGEDVMISVFSDEPDTVELICNGEVIENITVNGRSFFVRTPQRGYYVARLKNKSDSVEFCVNQAETRYEIHNGIITVYADPCDEKSVIHYMDFRQKGVSVAALEKYEELSAEEIQSGKITRPIPEGGKNFKVYYKNPYGIWTHQMTAI